MIRGELAALDRIPDLDPGAGEIAEELPPPWLEPAQETLRNTAHHPPDFDFALHPPDFASVS